MDIPKLSMAMSQLNVSTAISTALTKKILDDGQKNAQQIIESIDQIQDTNLGTNFDVSA